jgi:alpha-glucosidase
VNPYNFQEHIYDKNRPENIAFLKRFRAVLDEFPAIAAVGEVGDSQRGLEIVGEYTSGDDKMQMCYAFEFLAPDALTPARVAEVQTAFAAAAPEGWACWAFSNHDVVRHVSRWGMEVVDREAFAKMMAAILLTQRGSVCIYQGEELGLTEADIAYADLRDPYGIQFWPEFKGRDGCRTPMVWDAQALQAGFSTAEKTWLPIPVEHQLKAVGAQYGDPASVLEQYRRFLAFRKLHPALSKGQFQSLPVDDTVLGYKRQHGNETLLCLFNMSANEVATDLPIGEWDMLVGHGFESRVEGNRVELPPWGAYFARHT